MGKKGAARRSLARNAATNNFILIEPRGMRNADTTAKAIAVCRGVKKVFITSGDYGFIVSTQEDDEHTKGINSTVRRVVGNAKSKVARGHYVYSYRTKV